MKTFFLTSLFAIGAVAAFAQPIHNYPYDPSVTSYDALPYDLCGLPNAIGVEKHYVDLNAQAHWRTGNSRADATDVPQMQSPSLAHGHIRICGPYMAEVNKDVTVPFMVMVFQGESTVGIYTDRNPAVKSIVWDDGGGNVTTGDPNGLVMRTGHLTYDINFRAWAGDIDLPFFVPDHGLFLFPLEELVNYANGAVSRLTLYWSAWSMKNPNAPVWVNGSGIREGKLLVFNYSLNENTDRLADNSGALEWGSNAVDFNTWLPLIGPLRSDTLAQFATLPMAGLYNYGRGPQRGHGITRFDMDLHSGNLGVLYEDVPQTNFNDNTWNTTKTPFAFDALAALGVGFHSVTSISQQDSSPLGSVTTQGSFGPNEQSVSLLGFRMLIADGSTPAPTTCTDPTATNFGGPLPCTYPTPTPTPIETRQLVSVFQQLIDGIPQDRFFVCPTPDHCVELAIK